MSELQNAMRELGHVNLIVTGKSGTGKSTLINAVFRQELAAEGVGKPVTQSTRLYESPDMPIRVYDTKGLELDRSAQKESVKDIDELIHKQYATGDMDRFIYGVWYCINTGSNRVEDIELDVIKDICSIEETGVPVLVVFTQSYYREDAQTLQKTVENEIGHLPQYRGSCIIVAKPRDKQEAFGLDELIKMTADIIPDVLQRSFVNAQGVSIDAKIKACEKIISGYVVGAAITGGTPLPIPDAPALILSDIAMCAHITATFGLSIKKAVIADIVITLIGTAGVTIVGKSIVANILKMTGVDAIAGGIISGTTAALLTGALGRTYIAVLAQITKGELKEEDLQKESFKQKLTKMMKKELKSENSSKKIKIPFIKSKKTEKKS